MYGRNERPGEQALRGVLVVPGDVVVDDLMVVRGASAPVQYLLAGQVLKDQLLIIDGRLRGRGGYGRAGRGEYDRGHRRGRDVVLVPCGRSFSTG
ncbi:hypothetical protein [Streptomyces sp. NPDC056061]|uniref:hypothetical protein n=1 Tax=Streptomyces sp. NPDC056061 TaxID=3345700 RepID=UPI0035E37883